VIAKGREAHNQLMCLRYQFFELCARNEACPKRRRTLLQTLHLEFYRIEWLAEWFYRLWAHQDAIGAKRPL